MAAGRLRIPGVDAATPLGEAAPLLLAARAEPLFKIAAEADIEADADAVHDLRVATRRVREALRLVRSVYPAKPAARWYRRIRRLTRALGRVREADVALAGLAGVRSELADADALAVALCIGVVAGRRECAVSDLRAELARVRLPERRREFERFAVRPRSTSGGTALGEVARTEIVRRAREVAAAMPRALVPGGADAQHALRIDIKHLRYAYETFAPALGDGFDERHRFLTQLQDALGELHDAYVLDQLLGEVACGGASAASGVGLDDARASRAIVSARGRSAFERFSRACDEHPAEHLESWLLEPLG